MTDSSLRPAPRRLAAGIGSVVVLLASLGHAVAVPDAGVDLPPAAGAPHETADQASAAAHLVVSEVMTGGASASDEFIELYNPTDGDQSLEGLELVYVTASGVTITRKASWTAGAAPLGPGRHLLVANGAGIFAAIADLTYANGLAATGGSVALRAVAATFAIDAVGWGTAASSWLEGSPAPAPDAGHSLERLPGGSGGSGQDTDQNALDFIDSALPDPQNTGSLPVPVATPSPSASPSSSATPTDSPTPTDAPTPTESATATPAATETATPSPSPEPTPEPTPPATPEPTPGPISIAAARTLPDGATATVVGVALTDGDFTEGGGYVADESGAIAVLVSGGSFSRGQLLEVRGVVDDRYAQRTIRADASGILALGIAPDPPAPIVATGSIGEPVEARLVVIGGSLIGSPTELSGGLAFELDDGSGAVRVLVHAITGISTDGWVAGASLRVAGVVGQRDSSGTGTAGYRVQPRDASDLLALDPPPTPTPTPTPEPTPDPTPTPTTTPTPAPTDLPSATPSPSASPPPLVAIAEARAAAIGTRLRIRGVVTAPSGLIEDGSAVVQDASGAILVRLGDAAGRVALGELVEMDGVRSTRSGMLTLRVSVAPLRLGAGAQPVALRRATGGAGEDQEAQLLLVRGAITSSPQRTSGGSTWFSLDDGSGPLRIVLRPDSGLAANSLRRGAWIELTGVLGQETTGREPDRGYRLWPRSSADLLVLAAPTGSGAPAASASPDGSAGSPDAGVRTEAGSPVVGWPESDLLRPALAAAVPTVPASPDRLDSPIPLVGAGLGDRATDLPGLVALLIGFVVSLGTAAWRAWTGRGTASP